MSSDKSPPDAQLKLEWVYGYRGHQCRNNLFYLSSIEIVYFVAGVAIVMNMKNHSQRFFLGHSDDIISLAPHPGGKLIATGQVGKEHPHICIWNPHSMETISILSGYHKRGICGLSFSSDGKLMISVGLEDDHKICAWNWSKGQCIASAIGDNQRIFDVQFSPFNDSIVSCGVKHLKFWSLSGNTLTSTNATFTGEIPTVLSVVFAKDYVTYAGTLRGDILRLEDNKVVGNIPKAHTGGIFTMHSSSDGYASGDKDGAIRLWDHEFKPVVTINLAKEFPGTSVRSVCWYQDKLLVGTRDSEIFEIPISTKKPRLVSCGHSDGELWGLTTHPKKNVFATCSDDTTVRIWDMGTNECVGLRRLGVAARAVSFTPSGSHLAVGLLDGSWHVMQSKDLSDVHKNTNRTLPIGEIRFSPDGDFLAVGSNDGFLDIYDARSDYKHIGEGAAGANVTHIDWSDDSRYVQINTGAGQHLTKYFSIPKAKEVLSAEMKRTRWSTWTCVLGDEVNGIWDKYGDKDDINAVTTCRDTLVTGDDFGKVKLYRYPSSRPGAKARAYRGHSAHVTCVRFACDQLRLVSTGGADQSIFQWLYLPQGGNIHDGQDCELLDEASDSDLSDVEGWDSDIESELNRNYDHDIGRDELADMKQKQKVAIVQAELCGASSLSENSDEKRSKAPADGIQLEFVHGYRGFDTRNNIYYTASGEIAYHAAAVGIVYDPRNHTQRFYLGHTDDILCLDMHPSQAIVATGQIGKEPSIHIWETDRCEVLSILKGTHTRGICCVDFSPDGKKLCTVGVDDDHLICVWNWAKGEMLASTKGHKDKIFVAKWNHYQPDQFISAGVKHIKFWSVVGGGMTSRRGTFGDKGKLDTMCCVEFNGDGEAFSGCQNGSIYRWQDNILVDTLEAHSGPVFGIHQCDGGFATGGKDGVIRLWDHKFKPISSVTVEMETLKAPCIRAVCWIKGRLVAGMKTGQIVEVSQKTGKTNILIESHAEGEVWGLDTHPGKDQFLTTGSDFSLRVWDLRHQKLLQYKTLKKASKSCAFSPDGKFLAVGFLDGSFAVLDVKTLKEVAKFHHRKEQIGDLKFSPNGKYLAVGSNDNFVDIYNTLENKRVGVCKGASSYITHVDWARNSKLLQVNTGAREHLFFEAPRGKRQAIKSAVLKKIDWNENTSVLGPCVEGIWPKFSDVTDVNSAHLTNNGKILATGDDFGFVKLFDYPVLGKNARYKKYVGHAAHVTNVRWSYDDGYLVSVGGADTTVMVWRHSHTTEKGEYSGNSCDSDTESEAEGGVDEDVETLRKKDYNKPVKALRPTSSIKPHMRPSTPNTDNYNRDIGHTVKVNKSPKVSSVTNLELDFVFGFRGFDTHQNLAYLANGDIVFHTAAVGVVFNVQEGKQNFYKDHTDDIISLGMHPSGEVIATGQVGKEPTIQVWETKSFKTLSIMKGQHTHGVTCLSFSPNGKLLASVGLDNSHTVVVYKWKSGAVTAQAKGHSDAIFVCEFRPDDPSKFVTAGVKHIKFWTVAGSELISKKGIFGKVGTLQTMLSIAFGPEGKTFSGSQSGDIYLWQDQNCIKTFSGCHVGAVWAMFTSPHGVVSGGKDGMIKVWDGDMKKSQDITLGSKYVVTAVFMVKGRILVGTKSGEIIECSEKGDHAEVVLSGHSNGELWGLATHPSKPQFATCSDDKTLRLWDIKNRLLIKKLNLKDAGRSVAFSPDGTLLAVGLKSGEFVVYVVPTLKEIMAKRDRKETLHDIRFSPCGKYLAVASNDNFVDIYKNEANFPRIGFCRGNSSFITHIDWSTNSSNIQTNSGDYAHLFYSVPTCKQNHKVDDVTWDTWTSVLGKDILGIWPKGSDKTDVNASNVDKSASVIVTGDDFGNVCLYPFPCPEKISAHKTYKGHSAHVTNVRFSHDNKYLLSTGGGDASIFMWRAIS